MEEGERKSCPVKDAEDMELSSLAERRESASEPLASPPHTHPSPSPGFGEARPLTRSLEQAGVLVERPLGQEVADTSITFVSSSHLSSQLPGGTFGGGDGGSVPPPTPCWNL